MMGPLKTTVRNSKLSSVKHHLLDGVNGNALKT